MLVWLLISVLKLIIQCMLSNTVRRPIFSHCCAHSNSFIFTKKISTMYNVRRYIHTSWGYRLSICRHTKTRTIHSFVFVLNIFFFRDMGAGGEGLLPLKIHGWFSTQYTMLNGSLRIMYILKTRIIPCWIPGLPPCEKSGFRPSFNRIRRTTASFFLLARVSTK